jgi:hypothetical protein
MMVVGPLVLEPIVRVFVLYPGDRTEIADKYLHQPGLNVAWALSPVTLGAANDLGNVARSKCDLWSMAAQLDAHNDFSRDSYLRESSTLCE